MRRNREHVIVMVVLATTLASRQVVAQTAVAAPAPAAEATPAAAQPTPKVAAMAPRGGQTALWSEGFMGDAGQGTGIGLRAGLLAGSRMGELWSLNFGFAFDKVTVDAPDSSDYVFDAGFNPLFHFPQEKLEIVAGPVAGIFLDKFAAGSGAVDIWKYGWTIGANTGLFFRVGSKVRLGGLLNFFLRNPIKACVTANGMDECQESGLDSAKVLSFSLAALL